MFSVQCSGVQSAGVKCAGVQQWQYWPLLSHTGASREGLNLCSATWTEPNLSKVETQSLLTVMVTPPVSRWHTWLVDATCVTFSHTRVSQEDFCSCDRFSHLVTIVDAQGGEVLSAAEQSQCVHNQGVASLIRYSSLIQQQTRLTQENIKIENLLIRTFSPRLLCTFMVADFYGCTCRCISKFRYDCVHLLATWWLASIGQSTSNEWLEPLWSKPEVCYENGVDTTVVSHHQLTIKWMHTHAPAFDKLDVYNKTFHNSDQIWPLCWRQLQSA